MAVEIVAPGEDHELAAWAEVVGAVEGVRWALEVELVRALSGGEREPALPAGLEVVALADRPDLLDSAWEACAAAYSDLPLPERVTVTRDEWLAEDVAGGRALTPLTLVAVREGSVPAFAGALTYGAEAGAMENGLTAVLRELRGRRLATTLKQVQAARAARLGSARW
jgi:hypothetical protein